MCLPVPGDEGCEAGHHEGGGHGVQAEAGVQLQHGGAQAHNHETGHDQQQASEMGTFSLPTILRAL